MEIPVGGTAIAALHGEPTMKVDFVEWDIGGVRLVAIPGEAFHLLGREISSARGDRVLLAGIAPAWHGYLPAPVGRGRLRGGRELRRGLRARRPRTTGGRAIAVLDLFPRPRHLELRGTGAPLDAAARETHVDTLPAQGYELTIEGGNVTIRHADDAGLRYARSTLEQIRAQSSGGLPGVHVTDHPDFPHRAYMLDVSRDRVPTRETLERIVGILALARINQLQLYTEHTFAYEAHEIVWENASPITPDDVRWLDALCAANGIELVANQNCFGHMNRWLMHPEYRDRAECPDGAKAPWGAELPPWTLEPTPRQRRVRDRALRRAAARTSRPSA